MSNEVKDFFNSLAPNWDAMENHTIDEKKVMLDKLDIRKGDKIIDIACGTGVITSLLHEYSQIDVLGIDIAEKMIAIAKEKYKECTWAHFECEDFLRMDNKIKFDYAVIYNAYPHFQNVEALANKLYDMLNTNGKFAIIHTLSRKELSAHHSGNAHSVSRDLLSPEEESKAFNSYFDILKAEETDHSYLITGVKKN